MDFPYKKYNGTFSQSPQEKFEILKTKRHKVNTEEYIVFIKRKSDIDGIINKTSEGYNKNYIPFKPTKKIALKLKELFRINFGRDTLYLRFFTGDKDEYEINVLSDYFIEDKRIKCKRLEQSISPYDWYFLNIEKLKTDIVNKGIEINPFNLREELYSQYKECNHFKATIVGNIIDIFESKKMLDFSAGWGDRLLGAMSRDIEYLGIDPNLDLVEGHNQMIEMFGDPSKHKIIYKPSEKVDFNTEVDKDFDLIFTSPPFYDLEIYSSEGDQSIILHDTYEEWMVNFLFYTIERCWSCLSKKGFMLLYMGDSPNNYLVEPMLFYIIYKLLDSKYLGVISVSSSESQNKLSIPIYIFKKSNKKSSPKLRQSVGEEFLNNYPRIYSLL